MASKSEIKINPNVVKAFKDYPEVSIVYVSDKGLVYFSPSARKCLTAISRQEVENKSTNKNNSK